MAISKDLPQINAERDRGHGKTAHKYVNGQSNEYMNSKEGGHLDSLHNGYPNVAINSHARSHVNGHAKVPQTYPTPIAICGLAMRLPGGIRDADSFWSLLRDGKDARGPVPSDRYNVNGFNDSLGQKGAIKTPHGYFLDEELACLDTSFFSMTKIELEKADPQQRQLLEVTRECLENAGETEYRGKSIGCYVGTFGEDWLQMSAKESQHSGGYVLTGHGDLMLANRVSYEYDFTGPRYVGNDLLLD